LFVEEEYRGRGFARLLFKHLGQICAERKLPRMEWVYIKSVRIFPHSGFRLAWQSSLPLETSLRVLLLTASNTASYRWNTKAEQIYKKMGAVDVRLDPTHRKGSRWEGCQRRRCADTARTPRAARRVDDHEDDWRRTQEARRVTRGRFEGYNSKKGWTERRRPYPLASHD